MYVPALLKGANCQFATGDGGLLPSVRVQPLKIGKCQSPVHTELAEAHAAAKQCKGTAKDPKPAWLGPAPEEAAKPQ